MLSDDYKPYYDVALEAAHKAGALIREKLGKAIHIDKKGRINLVTEVDTASEALITEIIMSHFPDHSMLGEESGQLGAAQEGKRWIVDPLDGTTNFAQGYPFFSVSIAFEIDGEVVVGVVYDPIHNETFHAIKGQGAFLNGLPITVSNHDTLEESLLVTGFPYDVSSSPDIHLGLFKDLVIKARGIRRDGSAALDLCYIACGRFDAFWELGLSPWDMAAGSLIVREAGGRMSDFLGKEHNLVFRDMLASNKVLHEAMLKVINPYVDDLRSSPYWIDLESRKQGPICKHPHV